MCISISAEDDERYTANNPKITNIWDRQDNK